MSPSAWVPAGSRPSGPALPVTAGSRLSTMVLLKGSPVPPLRLAGLSRRAREVFRVSPFNRERPRQRERRTGSTEAGNGSAARSSHRRSDLRQTGLPGPVTDPLVNSRLAPSSGLTKRALAARNSLSVNGWRGVGARGRRTRNRSGDTQRKGRGDAHHGSGGLGDLVIRRLAVVALAYRTLSIPLAILGLVIEDVRIRMTPAFVLVATILWVVNLALSIRVARGDLPPWLSSWGFFTADGVTAVLVNVWAATLVPHGALLRVGRDPFTPYVVGGTALWTALRGSGTGLGMVVGATGMEFGMLGANHAPFGKTSLIVVAVRVLWIGSAWAAGWFVRSFASRGAALVQRRGEELGREKERTRMLRTMHDTVLQTLEAVVAAAEREDQPAAARLGEIAQSAGAQAIRLRTTLRQADEATGPLYDELAPVVERFETRTGIRSELVHLGETPELEPGQAEALLGALGEALRNVEKHARATKVNIFLETGDDRLRLVIKDDGCGFDPYRVRPDALGIVQSIVARLEEVGGGSNIESRPGGGTRLELWVPL